MLSEYHWTGNVRELKNVIQRAVLICRSRIIHDEHLPNRIRTYKRNINDIVIPLGSTLKEAEKVIINKTLTMTKGNRKKAAEILGISRRTLYNKMFDLKIL